MLYFEATVLEREAHAVPFSVVVEALTYHEARRLVRKTFDKRDFRIMALGTLENRKHCEAAALLADGS